MERAVHGAEEACSVPVTGSAANPMNLTGGDLAWGWTVEEWDAAIEAEVARSTGEQGLPVEVADEVTLGRVARLLVEQGPEDCAPPNAGRANGPG